MKKHLLIASFCLLPIMVNAQNNRTPTMTDEFGGVRNSRRAAEAANESGLKPGDHRMLFLADKKRVPIALSYLDLKDLIKSVRAKDDYGVIELLKRDAFFGTPTNSEVIILDTTTVEIGDEDYPIVKVRVIKGPAQGRAGWVPQKWLFEISG